MNREQKEQSVEELKGLFSSASAGVLVDYQGLSANDLVELRKKLNETQSSMKVLKNTLARIAVKDTPYAELQAQFVRARAMVFSDNPVEQAAVMADQQDRTIIAPQVILKPQAGFEIEMVGRFVQQQQVGLGEQQRCQRYPHAPATRKFTARLLLTLLGKSKPGKKAGGPRRRALRPFVV